MKKAFTARERKFLDFLDLYTAEFQKLTKAPFWELPLADWHHVLSEKACTLELLEEARKIFVSPKIAPYFSCELAPDGKSATVRPVAGAPSLDEAESKLSAKDRNRAKAAANTQAMKQLFSTAETIRQQLSKSEFIRYFETTGIFGTAASDFDRVPAKLRLEISTKLCSLQATPFATQATPEQICSFIKHFSDPIVGCVGAWLIYGEAASRTFSQLTSEPALMLQILESKTRFANERGTIRQPILENFLKLQADLRENAVTAEAARIFEKRSRSLTGLMEALAETQRQEEQLHHDFKNAFGTALPAESFSCRRKSSYSSYCSLHDWLKNPSTATTSLLERHAAAEKRLRSFQPETILLQLFEELLKADDDPMPAMSKVLVDSAETLIQLKAEKKLPENFLKRQEILENFLEILRVSISLDLPGRTVFFQALDQIFDEPYSVEALRFKKLCLQLAKNGKIAEAWIPALEEHIKIGEALCSQPYQLEQPLTFEVSSRRPQESLTATLSNDIYRFALTKPAYTGARFEYDRSSSSDPVTQLYDANLPLLLQWCLSGNFTSIDQFVTQTQRLKEGSSSISPTSPAAFQLLLPLTLFGLPDAALSKLFKDHLRLAVLQTDTVTDEIIKLLRFDEAAFPESLRFIEKSRQTAKLLADVEESLRVVEKVELLKDRLQAVQAFTGVSLLDCTRQAYVDSVCDQISNPQHLFSYSDFSPLRIASPFADSDEAAHQHYRETPLRHLFANSLFVFISKVKSPNEDLSWMRHFFEFDVSAQHLNPEFFVALVTSPRSKYDCSSLLEAFNRLPRLQLELLEEHGMNLRFTPEQYRLFRENMPSCSMEETPFARRITELQAVTTQPTYTLECRKDQATDKEAVYLSGTELRLSRFFDTIDVISDTVVLAKRDQEYYKLAVTALADAPTTLTSLEYAIEVQRHQQDASALRTKLRKV